MEVVVVKMLDGVDPNVGLRVAIRLHSDQNRSDSISPRHNHKRVVYLCS